MPLQICQRTRLLFCRGLSIAGLIWLGRVEGREEFFDGDIRLLKPWFTGPLVAPPGNALPGGVTVLQPYCYYLRRYGVYDGAGHLERRPLFTSFVAQLGFAQALANGFNIAVAPAVFVNRSEGKSSTQFADLPVGFDLNLYTPQIDSFWPSVKLGVRELLPTGSYNELNPVLLGTDISGSGSYTTIGSLVFRKLWFPRGPHYLSNIFSVRGLYFAPAHLTGLSVYGGAQDTNGRIYPGAACQLALSFEYSLTDNWALALDNVFVFAGKDKFYGFAGTDAEGKPAQVGRPASKQLSFAPAIEYNFRRGFGIIAGCWFTVWGENSRAFTSAVASVVFAF
jgi:hypothetical protein